MCLQWVNYLPQKLLHYLPMAEICLLLITTQYFKGSIFNKDST